MPFVPEVAAFFGFTLPDYLGIGLSSALTIAGAFVNTALFNKNTFGLSANVYINYPSLGSSIYITLIGSPEVESTSGSESLYPMGIIVNSSSYYNMGGLILGMQCNT